MNRLVPLLATPFVLIVAAPAAAQAPTAAPRTSGSVAAAVNSITANDIARRIGVIAHDSMRGRDTPSPELEEVAHYIAGEFRRFGLRPAGDSGSYLQRYGIVRKAVDTARTRVVLTGSTTTTLKAGAEVNLVRFGPLPDRELVGPIVLFAGPTDSANPLGGADVRGSWVAQVLTASPQGVQLDQHLATTALQAGAVGLFIITNRPDAQWQNRLGRVSAPMVSLEGVASDAAPAIVEIRDETAARLLGLDVAATRAATRHTTRRLEGFTLTFRPVERVASRVTAPNVVGVLEGSDPTLKDEYLVFSAHMDHVGVAGLGGGCSAVGADSICNGADDDASGTIAVVEAAEAFAMLQPRPKRSIIFLTVSGEEKGLWGSAYFTDHPPVPMNQIVADLNLDMVGRNWKDTIAVIGKEHSDLGATLNRVGAAHPELRMQPIDDIWPQENFYFRSDHYNFARKGVPILFFFNGTHADYHQPSDQPAAIDAEKESRIVKLVFYLGLEVANTVERPKWNPESYSRIVEATN